MHPRTRLLLPQLRKQRDHKKRLQQLRQRFSEATCYILGCGSSLSAYSAKELREKLADKLVIAMKQAYLPVAGVADFHCLSQYKYIPYAYPAASRPVILGFHQQKIIRRRGQQLTINRRFPRAAPVDILMPLHHGGEFDKSLVVTQQFDSWRMDRSFDRCCGPGMLYELAFYLAVHLGVREIRTLGVDFDRQEHFYQTDPQILRQVQRQHKREALHGSKTEWQQMIAGIPLWKAWLELQGIRWCRIDAPGTTPVSEHISSCPL